MPRATALPPPRSDATRSRLVAAAGEVFASRGLRGATVREICAKAEANVAAVGYHFGGKDELYAAVLLEAYRDALQQYPPLLGVADDAPADERLHAFVHSFLLRILDEGRPAWFGKLMLREMAEPTGALGPLVDRCVRPVFELLTSIVRELMSEAARGRAPAKPLVQRCVASVVGQCTFYKNTRHVYSKLNPDQRYDRAAIADLAAHVSQFSLASIRALATGQPQRKESRRAR